MKNMNALIALALFSVAHTASAGVLSWTCYFTEAKDGFQEIESPAQCLSDTISDLKKLSGCKIDEKSAKVRGDSDLATVEIQVKSENCASVSEQVVRLSPEEHAAEKKTRTAVVDALMNDLFKAEGIDKFERTESADGTRTTEESKTTLPFDERDCVHVPGQSVGASAQSTERPKKFAQTTPTEESKTSLPFDERNCVHVPGQTPVARAESIEQRIALKKELFKDAPMSPAEFHIRVSTKIHELNMKQAEADTWVKTIAVCEAGSHVEALTFPVSSNYTLEFAANASFAHSICVQD